MCKNTDEFSLDKEDLCFTSCISHSTQAIHVEPIALRGLLPGSGGITQALRAEMSAAHRSDAKRIK